MKQSPPLWYNFLNKRVSRKLPAFRSWSLRVPPRELPLKYCFVTYFQIFSKKARKDRLFILNRNKNKSHSIRAAREIYFSSSSGETFLLVSKSGQTCVIWLIHTLRNFFLDLYSFPSLSKIYSSPSRLAA